jgi:hypothetical protein
MCLRYLRAWGLESRLILIVCLEFIIQVASYVFWNYFIPILLFSEALGWVLSLVGLTLPNLFIFSFLRDTSVLSIHHRSSLKRSLSSSSIPFLSHVLLFLMMLDTHLIHCFYFCNSVTRLWGICYHQNRVYLEHVMRKISYWKIGLGVFFCRK